MISINDSAGNNLPTIKKIKLQTVIKKEHHCHYELRSKRISAAIYIASNRECEIYIYTRHDINLLDNII